MGTNYHVHVSECPNPCCHCSARTQIHLGKSSMGWTFAFRAYPDLDGAGRSALGPDQVVTDFASWQKLLDLGPIEDEYGQAVMKEDLLALIESKRGGRTEFSTFGGAFHDSEGNRFIPGEFC